VSFSLPRRLQEIARVRRKDVGVSDELESVSVSASWNAGFKLEFHGTDTDFRDVPIV